MQATRVVKRVTITAPDKVIQVERLYLSDAHIEAVSNALRIGRAVHVLRTPEDVVALLRQVKGE